MENKSHLLLISWRTALGKTSRENFCFLSNYLTSPPSSPIRATWSTFFGHHNSRLIKRGCLDVGRGGRYKGNLKNSSKFKTFAFFDQKADGEKGPKNWVGVSPLPYRPMPKSTHPFFRYPFLSPHILEKMLEIAFAKIYLYPWSTRVCLCPEKSSTPKVFILLWSCFPSTLLDVSSQGWNMLFRTFSSLFSVPVRAARLSLAFSLSLTLTFHLYFHQTPWISFSFIFNSCYLS